MSQTYCQFLRGQPIKYCCSSGIYYDQVHVSPAAKVLLTAFAHKIQCKLSFIGSCKTGQRSSWRPIFLNAYELVLEKVSKLWWTVRVSNLWGRYTGSCFCCSPPRRNMELFFVCQIIQKLIPKLFDPVGLQDLHIFLFGIWKQTFGNYSTKYLFLPPSVLWKTLVTACKDPDLYCSKEAIFTPNTKFNLLLARAISIIYCLFSISGSMVTENPHNTDSSFAYRYIIIPRLVQKMVTATRSTLRLTVKSHFKLQLQHCQALILQFVC